MRVPGEDLPGVVDGVTMLRDVSLGKKIQVGKRVAVVGGGNSAMDASRTARRLGAKEVTVIYRRTQNEMPAAEEEVEEAMEEGVKFNFLTNPSKIEKSAGGLKMTLTRMKLGDEIDESGRRRPVIIEGGDFTQEFDMIIPAIGQVTAIPDGIGLDKNKNGTITADPDTLATKVEGVYAGGDAVTGPDSVIRAIAAGRLAAESIDKYLGGKGNIEEKFSQPETAKPYVVVEGGVEKRQAVPLKKADTRIKNFERGELGYTKELAETECSRCLRCDLEERDED
jgi:NADPH-dependent glutamate synthase beta subunit-like oxidoreductase